MYTDIDSRPGLEEHPSSDQQRVIMSKWLNCTVMPGMFSDEFTVVVKTRNGDAVSVFVPRDFAEAGKTEAGRVKVRILEQSGGALAVLPNEHQTVVAINASDLQPA
jgi:hypothetical protein